MLSLPFLSGRSSYLTALPAETKNSPDWSAAEMEPTSLENSVPDYPDYGCQSEAEVWSYFRRLCKSARTRRLQKPSGLAPSKSWTLRTTIFLPQSPSWFRVFRTGSGLVPDSTDWQNSHHMTKFRFEQFPTSPDWFRTIRTGSGWFRTQTVQRNKNKTKNDVLTPHTGFKTSHPT